MGRDACGSKNTLLRVRADDFTDRVEGPDRGTPKLKAYLMPAEVETLLACDEVPQRYRRVYALAAYTGLRRGELAALRSGDVHLDAGTIAVHRALDRAGEEGAPKTAASRRRVPIEASARPLVDRLCRDAGPGGRLLDVPPQQKLAKKLRDHLKVAGVRRADLFADDAGRKPVGFHDLRATCATWMALRGDDPLKIQRRMGHRSLETTQIYIREAEVIAASGVPVEPFPPLPPAVYAKAPAGLGMEQANGTGPRKAAASTPISKASPPKAAANQP